MADIDFKNLEFIKESLEAVFDGIPDGIIVMNKECQITRLNRQMMKWLKKDSFEEVLGKACHEVISNFGEIFSPDTCKFVLEKGEPHCSTLPVTTPQLPGLIFEPAFFPIKNENHITGIIFYLRDITQRASIQSQLIELERYRNVGPLAAGVAHEIRNPLTLIQSIAQLSLADNEKNHELKENLRSIIRHTKAANRVVTELIQFAKPTAFQFGRVEVTEVIEEACTLIKSRCQKEKIELTCLLYPQHLWVKLDREHFLQAILNFLLNAIESMDKHGKLLVSLAQHNSKVELRIQDSGKGMSAFQLEHAFDPFFTTKPEGIGLGLCVARQIIDSHGGQIFLTSKESEGTQVILLLPLLEMTPKEKPEIKLAKWGRIWGQLKEWMGFKKAA